MNGKIIDPDILKQINEQTQQLENKHKELLLKFPKFRAWDNDAQIMYPVARIDYEEEYIFPPRDKRLSWTCSYRRFEWVELMRSTRLFDKNNKEIFEGDIVKLSNMNNIDYISFNTTQGFYLTKSNKNLNECENLEIIGNIYENKDLINN